MASVKIIIKSKVYKNNESPVGLRIIIDRKDYFLGLINVDPKNWDEKKLEVKIKDPHNVKKNQLLKSNLRRVEDYLLECKLSGKQPSMNEIKNTEEKSETLEAYLLQYINKLGAEGRFRTRDKFKGLHSKLVEWGHEQTGIKSVDRSFVQRFEKYLNSCTYNGRPLSVNTVAKDLGSLRTLMLQAVIDELIVASPFTNVKIKTEKTFKNKLGPEDINILESLKLDNPRHQLALDTWRLSYYLRGIRAADVLTLKCESYTGDRIKISESKTDKKKDIKITEKSKEILDRYNSSGRKYILPWLPEWVGLDTNNMEILELSLKKVNSVNSSINSILEEVRTASGVKKHFTMHTARHSFATALYKKGNDLETIRNLLNHSSIQITENYIRSLMEQEEMDKITDDLY
jgi:integrase/recombinase XerD